MQKIIVLWGITAVILVSCTGETTTTRNIKNDSTDTLRFQLYKQGGFLTDTLTLFPGEKYRASIGTANRAIEEDPDCSTLIDSAYFEVQGGGKVTKLIQLNQNWTVESEQTKTVPPKYEYICTFTISNSDIEK